MALAGGLSPRNVSLLHEEGLAPKPLGSMAGRGSYRLYSSSALGHFALIGAIHLAGFELMVAARLAKAFAEEAEAIRGTLHSNLAAYLQAPHNPRPGHRPWADTGEDSNHDDDFWLHCRLRESPVDYRRFVATRGDMLIDIADHEYVLTEFHGTGAVKVFSPVSGSLPASPEYRILGRGSAARIVPITDEVASLDFEMDPASAARFKALEEDYISARENAVTRIRINVSLAIRNAFDRVRDDRLKVAA
jgi:hypothetical protein